MSWRGKYVGWYRLLENDFNKLVPTLSDIENGLCEGSIKVLISGQELGPKVLEHLEDNLKRYYGVKRFVVTPYA